jgi:hypothetical protein
LGDLGGDVAREGSQDCPHSDRVAAYTVDGVDVGAPDLIEVVTDTALRIWQRSLQSSWPASAAHQLGQVGEVEPWVWAAHRSNASDEPGQGDGAAAVPRFEHAHGAHPQARDPPCSGVASDVIGWRRGSRQDELAIGSALVDLPADRRRPVSSPSVTRAR